MRHLVIALFTAALPCFVQAADQSVLGSRLLIKDPGGASGRKILLKAKEIGSPNSVVGNPVASGGTLTVSAYGGTNTAATFSLPAGTSALTGRPFWSGSAATGLRYRDSRGENGPVMAAQLRLSPAGVFRISATLDGRLGAINVLPPNLGTFGCGLLTLTGGDAYSVRFGDGTVKNAGSAEFSVSRPLTEGSCQVCGNGILDPGEQCDAPGTSCGAGGGTCASDCTCACESLDPADCLYPYPSDYLTKPDPGTDTGRRVNYKLTTMPKNAGNVPVEPSDYNLNDGFSPGSSILLHVPNVDLTQTGAAPITDIEQSLVAGSPTVIVNTDTLAHHLHFAELDANATSEPSRAMIMRPAVNFAEGTRYIVALRNMKDAGGSVIPPGPDFLAYRDNTPLGDPAKEARRPHMEALFTTLAAAGVPRNDLYLAWDFTVASQRNLTERLLFVRDDGFARLGANAPAFTVTTIENDVDSRIYRRVSGTYEVERYVDSTAPGARFALDANGLPTHQATPQVAPFQCIIPRAALADAVSAAVPARASIYGHGLLGSHTEVASGNVRDMANEHNFVFCATKWIGMSEDDVGNAIGILQNFSNFPSLTDRLQQAMLDQLFLARLMIHPNGFVSSPAFQDAAAAPVIDTSAVFYDGNSQGGIFGGTVMAIAQDITRGVLGVPGMNYSLLLTRSTDFTLYAAILNPAYTNQLQRPLVLALAQMLWDRSDPNGYAHHITANPLPNTPAHKVLLHVAFGDHQVSNVATEIQARTLGVSIYQPAIAPLRHSDVNPYFGIPPITFPFDGSALVIWDSGAATPPITNVAPSVSFDPHSDPRKSPVARTQKSDFLQVGGSVTDVCAGVPCTAPH